MTMPRHAEVTDAITNLSDAIAGLVEEAGVDKSALAHEIELVNEMIANLDDYVPSSVEGLADKLSSAQQVYDDANATPGRGRCRNAGTA